MASELLSGNYAKRWPSWWGQPINMADQLQLECSLWFKPDTYWVSVWVTNSFLQLFLVTGTNVNKINTPNIFLCVRRSTFVIIFKVKDSKLWELMHFYIRSSWNIHKYNIHDKWINNSQYLLTIALLCYQQFKFHIDPL